MLRKLDRLLKQAIWLALAVLVAGVGREALALPTVPAGYQIRVVASDGSLTSGGGSLDGIVADPVSGNLYVAVVPYPAATVVYPFASFTLYRITPAGVISLVGTYSYGHYEVVKMAWGPDGKIYTANVNDSRIYTIDPSTGASAVFGTAPGFGRYGIDFDSSGNLIFAPESDLSFYKVTPSGFTFLGSTNPSPPNGNHGDSFGIQPGGNYVVYSDNCGSPMNNYSVSTAGHVTGANYPLAWVGTTDLHSIYDPAAGTPSMCGYSNGAIHPVTGEVYSITSNFGLGITRIALTPASGGASTPFVTGAGNGSTGHGSSQRGIVDLTVGKSTTGAGVSLFFVDRFTATVYEVSPGDTVAPTASPTQSPAANGAGWNSTDVTVTWHWSDNSGGSGIDPANCTTSSTSSGEGASITLSASCKDLAGNTGNASYTVKVDKTNPTITPSATMAFTSPYTFGDWSNRSVIVHYTCADSLSGLASCSGDQFFISDTSTSTSGSATDMAGNSASSIFVLVRVDKTAPVITASATKADSSAYTAGTWTNQNVTVHFTCSDAGSGVATCPADQTVSAEGTTASISGTATDNAGNSASASFGPIKIDKTPPAISAAATTSPNAAGWYNSNVMVHFTCSDGLSGIPAAACPADQTLSAEGPAVSSVTMTVTDAAGNISAASNVVTVKIDKTPPAISAAATTSPNAAGWYNGDVVIHFTCSDTGSGIPASTCPADQTLSAEGAAVSSIAATVTDAAGNISAASNVVTVKIDKTPPAISAAATTSPNAAGWYNGDVVIHFTCSDAGSGIPACPANQTLSAEGAAVSSIAATVTDAAGNISAASNVVTVKIDKTAPAITASAMAGGNPYTAGAWTNQNVTVHFTCSDGGSGLATPCPADQIVSAEGTTVSVSGTATDNAGNSASASFGPIRIDKTPPVVSSSKAPAANGAGWNNSDVTVTFGCLDALSGVVSPGSQMILSTEGAGQSASGSCTDLAGNSSGATVSPINIDKTAPGLANLNAAPDPQQVGSPLTLSANLTDPVSGLNGWQYTVNGGAPVMLPVSGSTTTPTTQFTETTPGVYTVCARTFDLAGNPGTEDCIYAVFYDPNGGFVTGGGWIMSPAGAYSPDPTLSGKATFGFVSKYQNGASVPTGNTEFQFKAGNLNFKSTSYDWLVIAGARAQYKGSGTINGAGDYDFTLTAIDGQTNGGGGVDKFRLKIQQKGAGGVIYDNQTGAPDSADPSTALGGGSIQIQK